MFSRSLLTLFAALVLGACGAAYPGEPAGTTGSTAATGPTTSTGGSSGSAAAGTSGGSSSGGSGATSGSSGSTYGSDTWTSYAKPWFNSYCAHCHGQEFAEPTRVTAQASSIRAMITSKSMPPGTNDLSDADRARILAWFTCGMPQ